MRKVTLLIGALFVDLSDGAMMISGREAEKREEAARKAQMKALQSLDQNAGAQRTGTFGTSLSSKRLVVPNSDSVRNFLKNEGPVPFFNDPVVGNIGTHWIEEVEALASAATAYGGQNFNEIQNALTKAVDLASQRSFTSRVGAALGFDNLIPASIRSKYPVSRLRAIRIQRLLWVFTLLRRRYYELLPADLFTDKQLSREQSEAVFGLVKTTLQDIAIMTDTEAVLRGNFDWTLSKGAEETVSVAGQLFGTSKFKEVFLQKEFGEAMMTLYEIGKMQADVKLDRDMMQISLNYLGSKSKSMAAQAAAALLAVLNPVNVARGVGNAVTGLVKLPGRAFRGFVNMFKSKEEGVNSPATSDVESQVQEPRQFKDITPEAVVYFTKLFDETPISVIRANYRAAMDWLLYKSDPKTNPFSGSAANLPAVIAVPVNDAEN